MTTQDKPNPLVRKRYREQDPQNIPYDQERPPDDTVRLVTFNNRLYYRNVVGELTGPLDVYTLEAHDHSGDAGGGTFDAANLTSGAAGDGTVLTADGSSGAAWEALADHDHTGDVGDGGSLSGIFRSIHDLWFQDNVAANQTTVGLQRTDHVGSAPDAYANTLITGLPGEVQYIYVKLNANRSAGTLTVTLTVDGVAQSMTAVINTAVAFVISTDAAIAFTGAQRLTLTITTSADWAPTTADLRAGMIVAT